MAYEELPMPPSHRHAIINAMVYVHQTLFTANQRITKKGGRTTAITPRHYLDFINQYVSNRIKCKKPMISLFKWGMLMMHYFGIPRHTQPMIA